jgi:hypothetical protein
MDTTNLLSMVSVSWSTICAAHQQFSAQPGGGWHARLGDAQQVLHGAHQGSVLGRGERADRGAQSKGLRTAGCNQTFPPGAQRSHRGVRGLALNGKVEGVVHQTKQVADGQRLGE